MEDSVLCPGAGVSKPPRFSRSRRY